jgi:hypothetical protein
MKIILDQNVKEGALRADRAWELFFESKSFLVNGLGVPEFADLALGPAREEGREPQQEFETRTDGDYPQA